MPDTSTSPNPFYSLLVSMGAAPGLGASSSNASTPSMLDAYRRRSSPMDSAGINPLTQPKAGQPPDEDYAIDSGGDSDTNEDRAPFQVTNMPADATGSPDTMQAHVDLLTHILGNGPQNGEAPKAYLSRQASSIQDLAGSGIYDSPTGEDQNDFQNEDQESETSADSPEATGIPDDDSTEGSVDPDLLAEIPDPGQSTAPAAQKKPTTSGVKPIVAQSLINGQVTLGYQTSDGKPPKTIVGADGQSHRVAPTLSEKLAESTAQNLGKGEMDCAKWLRQVGKLAGIKMPPGTTADWKDYMDRHPELFQKVSTDAKGLKPGYIILTVAAGDEPGHVETVVRARDLKSKQSRLYRVSASQGTRPGKVRLQLPTSGAVGGSGGKRDSQAPYYVYKLVDPKS